MKNYLKIFAATLFLFLTSTNIKAQIGASIRGFVYEAESGEAAMFANVQLAGTTYGASTDVNGYFMITKVPEGEYTLLVTYLGFDTVKTVVNLKEGKILDKKFFLKKSSLKLETVTINAEYIERRTETKTSVVKITPKTIRKIPSIGGQADIAQYLQVIPGVIFTGDQGGQFYIRGGSPIQNKVILDGMTIYNPFHSIGLFSVLETDLIRNADIYTGGFNAEYGGRISSIMDITYRDGNKKHYKGNVGVTTFGAKAVLEGPIVKQTSPDGGSSSFVLSFKHSYLAESSKTFYKYIDEDGLPFNFTDVYGKVSLNSSNGSKLSLFGFNFNDNVKGYKGVADYGWNSYGGGANFVVVPGKAPVLVEGIFAYSQYNSGINSVALNDRSSFISGFNGGLDFTYFFGKNTLKYGISMEGYRTEYLFTNFANAKIEQIENTTQLGIYVKYKAVMGKFILEPGFRLQWYASLANVSPEPRLSMKYNVTNRFRLKFAGGFYSQNLIAATSDRDVVNLFYGFLSGPENLPSSFNGEPITHKLQKAQHLILGGEFDITKRLFLNIEGYYKYFSQLTNINRFKIYNSNNAPEGAPDRQTKDFIIEQGNAYGVDMVLKYDYQKWYVWFVYSLGYVNRLYENKDGELDEYTPHFDRRHNINAVISYITGTKKQWEFSARWNFGTGFPFTQVQGFYEHLQLPGGVNTDYPTENGHLGLIYADIFQGRLPTYHRLDFDMKRNFYLSENTKMILNVSITNVYNRKNIFYVDLVTSDIVYQLPFMPSVGLSLYF
jgi:hypothetical protein